MRTTLEIDDDVLNVARAVAESEGRSLGKVISRLARRGLQTPTATSASGLPVFDVRDDAPRITSAMVRSALDE